MYLYEDNGEKVELDQEYLQGLYDILNDEYFDGKLGDCTIGTFSGRKVRTLGYFHLNSTYVDQNKRMFVHSFSAPNGRIYIDSDNFAELCKPEINLNANYKWTTKQMEATLLHEMCHYWTWKRGNAPTQGHGPEFRMIASHVSKKSDGKFSIQRLASAEEMQNLELDPELRASMQKRAENKINNTYVILLYRENGTVYLSRTTSWQAIAKSTKIHSNTGVTFISPAKKIEVYRDKELTENLNERGYSSNCIGELKWWDITRKDFSAGTSLVDMITAYPHKTLVFADLSNEIYTREDQLAEFVRSWKN